ncbi:Myosin type-2 heavy chain [Trichinella pseudospiralis]
MPKEVRKHSFRMLLSKLLKVGTVEAFFKLGRICFLLEKATENFDSTSFHNIVHALHSNVCTYHTLSTVVHSTASVRGWTVNPA